MLTTMLVSTPSQKSTKDLERRSHQLEKSIRENKKARNFFVELAVILLGLSAAELFMKPAALPFSLYITSVGSIALTAVVFGMGAASYEYFVHVEQKDLNKIDLILREIKKHQSEELTKNYKKDRRVELEEGQSESFTQQEQSTKSRRFFEAAEKKEMYPEIDNSHPPKQK